MTFSEFLKESEDYFDYMNTEMEEILDGSTPKELGAISKYFDYDLGEDGEFDIYDVIDKVDSMNKMKQAKFKKFIMKLYPKYVNESVRVISESREGKQIEKMYKFIDDNMPEMKKLFRKHKGFNQSNLETALYDSLEHLSLFYEDVTGEEME